jgi:hypothetical protein
MMNEFDSLLKTLEQFQGVIVLDSSFTPDTYITFKCESTQTLSAISAFLQEIQDSHRCKLLNFPNYEDGKDVTYQISFDGDGDIRIRAIIVLNKLLSATKKTGNVTKTRHQELGLPDLSLITMRQMAGELKRRENITFAVVWIEDNERDNIAIEGSGNPTQLVGLLARGLHMAIEWADKNIKFHKPREE